MSDIVSKVFSGMPIPVFIMSFVREAEKLSAAKALPRKPERVIAT